jgi:alkylation response protein AidB-like acyl-CoA dehydrogenase
MSRQPHMIFALSDEQDMLRKTAQSFFRDKTPITRLRNLRDQGANGKDPETREKLAELGLFGVLIPGAAGDDDFGMVGMGHALEAQGKALAATPLLQTALIAVEALRFGGTEVQRDEWLPRIAEGKVCFALAVDETAHHAPTSIIARAERDTSGYILNGSKRFVPNAHFAEMLLIVAVTAGADGLPEPGLYMVPRDCKGVSIEELCTADAHGAADVSLRGCVVSETSRLGSPGEGRTLLDSILDRARIGAAAEILGVAQGAFDLTLDYLRTRKQFGQLIGSFQALQHRAAKMFIELELTRSCVMAALSAVDRNEKNLALPASLAKGRAGDTAHLITNECVQLHGGIGMTDEHDAGLYLKRARVLEALYGAAGFHRSRYASLRGF